MAPERAAADMTRLDFDRQMARLAGLRFVPADLTTHWEGLADVPDRVLVEAISRAQRTRTDFPTPLELRQDADATTHADDPEEDRSYALAEPLSIQIPHRPLPLVITREWKFYCDVCADTGWQTYWCGATPPHDWLEQRTCERRREHDAHEYVTPCACRETNPAIVKRKAHQAKYATKAGKATA